jgi:hypothetical protein
MKTVQKGNDIKRVKDDEAELMVKNRGYKYVPKSAYKEATRPAKKVKEETKEDDRDVQ